MDEIKRILKEGTATEMIALFSFDSSTSVEKVVFKFNLWSRYFFNRFFFYEDAEFHKEIDRRNSKIYLGHDEDFLNICFRGASKTSRTKLFIAFCILNDTEHLCKYIKILSREQKNSTQFVTDIYNMMVQPRINALYPDVFKKTSLKREETMSSFTTSWGVKITASTVGSSQRGNVQDESRPDLLIFDDIEDRISLRSAIVTQSIWDNMQEAVNGLSKIRRSIYLGNYLSERGNIHKLVERIKNQLIVPIIKDGVPLWPQRDTVEDIVSIQSKADDFAGEYLCEPSAGADVFFDRKTIDKQEHKTPIRTIGDFKIYHSYESDHRYGMGADVAGGVGLDSSTSVIIDFSTMPPRVVATYASNLIRPDAFGDEIKSQADRFGAPLVAVENNKFDMTIGRLKQIYDNLYFTEQKATRLGTPPKIRTYGWNTNSMTKSKMMNDLKKAVNDGHLELSDPDLIAELRAYTRDDLMDKDDDVRLTTRHFDLLVACAIAYQMKDLAEVKKEEEHYQQPDYERPINEEE